MYSKAKIAGHPLHPMLIAFPIAFYVGTVASLFAYIGTRDLFWYRLAFVVNVVALIMAAIAVIPGVIDLFSTPQRSEARQTGYKHAGLNVLTLVLFLISAIVLGRNWGDPNVAGGVRLPDVAAPLVLGIIGVFSLLGAGWFGWTLVQTHHVGVVDREAELHGPGEPMLEEHEAYVPPSIREPDRQIPIRH
jgi:uncharacterized membrane protein